MLICIYKLCISLIFGNYLMPIKQSYLSHVMHNLFANFVKTPELRKDFSKEFVNGRGNLTRRGVVPWALQIIFG